jgi:amino acid transporter
MAGLLAAGLTPAIAHAQSVGDIGASLADQTGQINTFVTILAFVLGVALAIAGLMKFYNNSKNPNDPSAKMSTAFILIFAGAGLVALPAVLGSGITTFFGEGGDTTNASAGFDSLN